MFPGPARRLPRLLVLVALLCACVPAVARATTYTVDRSDDDGTATQCTGADNDCSLRGALTDVEGTPDTTDTIVIPAITVALDSELPAASNPDLSLTISGAGARSTLIDAQGNGRILAVEDGSVSFQSLVLANGTTAGTSSDNGGALYLSGGSLNVQDSGVIDSHADSLGGGIWNDGGTLTISRSLFTGNSAVNDGAAVDTDAGSTSIVNSTITGNDGPYAVDSDTGDGNGTVLSFVTLSGNTGSDSCGCNAFYISNNIGSANNTIITNNSAGDGECSDLLSTGNVIDDDGSCVAGASGDQTVSDAMLGSLSNNGGPTDTLGLLPGSPAIGTADSGACPATDQRGVARPVGGPCDVGAFEGVLALPASGGAPSLPTVSDVSPTTGPAGTFVGITGRNFDSVSQVLFGGVPTSFSIDGYNHVTAVAPAGGAGAVDIQVVNPAGKSVTSPTDVFTYAATAGPAAGGQTADTSAKQVCVMPDLHRHSYRYAKKLLARAGCVGALTHKGHAKHPPSHVKSQNPAAGAPLLAGGTISLKLG